VSSDALRKAGAALGKCQGDEQANRMKVESAFLAHSLLSSLLLIVSVQAFRRATGTWVAVAAVLALLYVLTWPYAYGKLHKSTHYEYGVKSQEVKLWEIPNSEIMAIKEIYQEDVIAWKTLQAQPCPDPGAAPQ